MSPNDQSKELLKLKVKLQEHEISMLKSEIRHLQAVFDYSPMMIYFKDDKNTILKVNKLAAEAVGVKAEELENRPSKDFFPGEADSYYQDDLEVINSGQPKLGIVETMKTSTGKIFVQTDKVPWRDESGQVKGVIVLVSDITIRKKYEEEIYKGQKLKSLGTLAGGLAHDLNNLLGGIAGNIDLALLSMKDREDATLYLNRIIPVIEKSKHLTQQLLTFAQGGAPVKKTVSIDELLAECVDFFSAGSNVTCQIISDTHPHFVSIDANQISQVINNMIMNSQQAMPDGGKITIKIGKVTLGKTETGKLNTNISHFIKISIKDHGQGISPEIIDNIFDPFFTTKEKGTGLGLSISHSIIKRHGGFIDVKPNLPKGTIFSIYLPDIQGKLDTAAKETFDNGHIRAKVLLMDDEEFILDVTSGMLKMIGCECVCVKNGEEAIEQFESASTTLRPFDIVILDLTIHEGMGGKETIRRLRLSGQPFKAIVSSGYSNDPVMASPSEYGFDFVLPKPFGIEGLRQGLRNLIGG